jgi:hypothetical protein
MNHLPMVFAYLGPETMLPMTSVVAGVAGVLMMFGRSSVRWIVGKFRSLASKPKAAPRLRRIGTGPVGRSKTAGMTRERAQN